MLLAAIGFCGCDAPLPSATGATNDSPEPAKRAESVRAPVDPPGTLVLHRGGALESERVPVVIFIHGMGDRPRSKLFDGFDGKVRVLIPRAPVAYGPGFRWFEYQDGTTQQAIGEGIAQAGEQLAIWLVEVGKRKTTLGKPIIVGFSQGGMLSLYLATHHAHKISAALPIAGYLPKNVWPNEPAPKPQPTLRVVHGTADQIVPIEPMRELGRHLKALGWRLDLREVDGLGHRVDARVFDLLYQDLRAAVVALEGTKGARANSHPRP